CNVGCTQTLEDVEQQIALGCADDPRAAHVASNRQGNAIRREFTEAHERGWPGAYMFVLVVSVVQQVLYLLRIDIHREQQFESRHALSAAAQGHLAQVLRNELRVGHDHERSIAELYLGRPDIDAANVTFHAADADQVAYRDGAFGQQDQ